MRKDYDPFRLFDAQGRPLSSYETMEKRIKLLEHQRDRLLRALQGAKHRIKVEGLEPEKPIFH